MLARKFNRDESLRDFVDAARKTCLVLVLCVAALPGCKRKSAEKCDQAKSTVQQAVAAADFTAAKQWREYAYKMCEDTGALASLDQSIVSAQQAAEQKKVADAAAAQNAAQYVTLFTQFVGQNRTAPENASRTPDCGTDAAAAHTKQRWCKATRQVGTSGAFEVRYWEQDPKVVSFSTKAPKALTCEDLGTATVVKSWDVPASAGVAKRLHCDITAGALQGLHAVVTGAAGSNVIVFSPEYLAADEGLRKYAQAQ